MQKISTFQSFSKDVKSAILHNWILPNFFTLEGLVKCPESQQYGISTFEERYRLNHKLMIRHGHQSNIFKIFQISNNKRKGKFILKSAFCCSFPSGYYQIKVCCTNVIPSQWTDPLVHPAGLYWLLQQFYELFGRRSKETGEIGTHSVNNCEQMNNNNCWKRRELKRFTVKIT